MDSRTGDASLLGCQGNVGMIEWFIFPPVRPVWPDGNSHLHAEQDCQQKGKTVGGVGPERYDEILRSSSICRFCLLRHVHGCVESRLAVYCKSIPQQEAVPGHTRRSHSWIKRAERILSKAVYSIAEMQQFVQPTKRESWVFCHPV